MAPFSDAMLLSRAMDKNAFICVCMSAGWKLIYPIFIIKTMTTLY